MCFFFLFLQIPVFFFELKGEIPYCDVYRWMNHIRLNKCISFSPSFSDLSYVTKFLKGENYFNSQWRGRARQFAWMLNLWYSLNFFSPWLKHMLYKVSKISLFCIGLRVSLILAWGETGASAESPPVPPGDHKQFHVPTPGLKPGRESRVPTTERDRGHLQKVKT